MPSFEQLYPPYEYRDGPTSNVVRNIDLDGTEFEVPADEEVDVCAIHQTRLSKIVGAWTGWRQLP